MMKIVIIEDEKPAAEKLSSDLVKVRSDVEILKIIHDVRSAISWFKLQHKVDLIFMDVELSDGLSFEILESIEISCPIIFITAYDHYWQKALTLNGIDYLLKPVDIIDLEKALSKYDLIRRHFNQKLDALFTYLKDNSTSTFKEKFLVRRGKELVMVPCAEIMFFKVSHKATMMITTDQKKLIIEESLLKLEDVLDPKTFIRANRQFTINIDFIKRIKLLQKGRLIIEMYDSKEEIVIAQEKANYFKKWLEGSLKQQ